MNILHGTILLVIAFLELLLSIYILAQNPKEEIRRWYSLATLSVVIWVGCSGLLFFTKNSNTALIYTNIIMISGTLMVIAFLFFSWVYPIRTFKIGFANWFFFFLPLVIFIFLAFSKTFPLEYEPIKVNFGWREVTGPAYPYFAILFLVYWAWGIVNLIKKYQALDGIYKWQLKNLLWGIGITSAISIPLVVILPWVGIWVGIFIDLSWIGAISSVAWLGFTSYILFKKNVGERR